MRKKPTTHYFLTLLFLLLAGLACGQPPVARATSTSTESPTATFIPSQSPPSATPFPRLDTGALWYLLRGGSRLDQGWGVDVDVEGNVYFATYQQDPAEMFADMVIYKFTSDGGELWQTRWGGPFMEKAFIVTVQNEIAYVGGLSYTSAGLTESEMVVIALDCQDGHLIWEFTWGQGYGYQEVDGLVVEEAAIYISGWTTGETTSNDAAILKLDLAGNLSWAQTWGTEGWDQADGQMVVTADRIYVAGRYNGSNMLLGGQGYIASFAKESGETLTHQTWGGPLFTDALGLTGDDTYLYVVGLTLDQGNGGQIFLRKYDLDLNLVWEQVWGGTGSESARSVAVDPEGNIYVAGESDSYNRANGLDIVLLRYDPDGVLLWSQTWGGSQNEGALGIALDGNYLYIAANTRSFGSGQDDALLLKVDALTGQFPSVEERR
jgi:hypothetical protein